MTFVYFHVLEPRQSSLWDAIRSRCGGDAQLWEDAISFIHRMRKEPWGGLVIHYDEIGWNPEAPLELAIMNGVMDLPTFSYFYSYTASGVTLDHSNPTGRRFLKPRARPLPMATGDGIEEAFTLLSGIEANANLRNRVAPRLLELLQKISSRSRGDGDFTFDEEDMPL